MVSSPITCSSGRHWVSTPPGMKHPQHKKTAGTFRPLERGDVLIVTVKTYDMDAALTSVKHLDVGSVLSIQNGVLKNEQLAQTFSWEKVLGAMAAFSGAVLPTGTVRFTVNQGLYLGELPEGTSTRVQTLGDTFVRAGILVQVT